MPDFCGSVLPNSFFVLTGQLREGDVLEDESLQRLLDAETDGCSPVDAVDVNVRRKLHCTASTVEQVQLKMRYAVGDVVSETPIEMILSMSRASVVLSADFLELGQRPLTTVNPHLLDVGCLVLLSASASDGGGVLCRVVEVLSAVKMKVVRAENADDPVPSCSGATLLPCESSFGPNDNVLVVYKQLGRRKKYDLFPGRSDSLELTELTPADCFDSVVATCWRHVEHHWELMLGTEFKNYEMTSVTLFRNPQREKLFFGELKHLESCAASRSRVCDWSVAADKTLYDKENRQLLQAQTMAHFNEFAAKFGLLPKQQNKDVNLSVAWWGKCPSAYLTNAQRGFIHLPSNLKLDPGYFGHGFYLTQYPRYSDYYISGCSLSSRKMQSGHLSLCYAALGRPYPVTQDPYDPPDYNRISASSLCGKPCGLQCGGSSSHDCHYASVKMHPDTQQFYPCPLRQQPDFDEIGLHSFMRYASLFAHSHSSLPGSPVQTGACSSGGNCFIPASSQDVAMAGRPSGQRWQLKNPQQRSWSRVV
jgi:hypothetical protein